jgi:hypothetical protein
MLTSDAIDAISAALAKAQGDIINPAKEAQNPHFRSHYADLSSGINAVRDGLSKNGIAFVQSTSLEGDTLMLETRLTHSSGQWLSSMFPVCRFPAKPQEVGSAMTYARRYALFALVGIAGEDDDGEAANKAETPAPRQTVRRAPPVEMMALEESRATRDLMINVLEMSESVRDLVNWGADNTAPISRLLEADRQIVRGAYADKMQSLKAMEKAA